jgi:uncharacterized membrane protein
MPLMLMALEILLLLLSLGVSLSLKPWRMLNVQLITPVLAAVVVLPWVWWLPQRMPSGLSIQLSFACLLVLIMGWPLAVPVLAAVGVAVYFLGDLPWVAVLSQLVWVGLVPAALAMAWGALLRRYLPPNPFVYTLGRAFLGTAVCVFLAGLMQALLMAFDPVEASRPGLVARWLMAWGDAFLTGMAAAIFVAFKPEWLATWSDQRYLRRP